VLKGQKDHGAAKQGTAKAEFGFHGLMGFSDEFATRCIYINQIAFLPAT
jgi:hypothetical protein